MKSEFREPTKKKPLVVVKETNLKCNKCSTQLIKIIETDKEGISSRGFAVCPCGGETFYYKAQNTILSFCHNDIIISEIETLDNGDQKIICQKNS